MSDYNSDAKDRSAEEKQKEIGHVHHLLSPVVSRFDKMMSCSRLRSATSRSISAFLSLSLAVQSRCVYHTKKTRKRMSKTEKGPYFSPRSVSAARSAVHHSCCTESEYLAAELRGTRHARDGRRRSLHCQ